MRILPAVLAASLTLPFAASAQQTAPQEPAGDKPVFSPMEFAAAQQNPKRFTVDMESIEIVRLQGADIGIALPKPPAGNNNGGGTTPPPQPGTDLPPFPPLPGTGGEDPITTIDRIVNLAKKIFDIIKENQPVIDITTTYANAIPDGITHWTQLAGWSKPETTTYAFYAKNMYGSRVVECKFQVIRQHSGNYRGKGKFLNSVTVQPLNVTASWGYKFGMKFEAPTVSNVGSSEDPVASMIARLNWSIDTVLKHETGTSVYYLEGNGAFREIGGPFTNSSRREARETIERVSEQLVPAAGAAKALEGARGAAARAW